MTNVESIFPYTIVEENGLYGITDNRGTLVVPCIMDEISNEKEEEVGLETWVDFDCVIVRKNEKYGFFTINGKFIEPAYDEYAVDPCGGDIHVRTDDCYGVLSAPDYLFEEIPYSSSLLTELYDEDNDENEDYDDSDEWDYDDSDEWDFDIEPMRWDEMGINPNVVSAIIKRLYALGSAFAEELWNAAYNQNSQDNIKEFVDETLHRLDDCALIEKKICDIKTQCEGDEIEFWEIVKDYNGYDHLLHWCANMIRRGAVNFISLKSMAYANIPLLNRKIKEHLKDNHDNGYYSTFRMIDCLLPCPDYGSFDLIPIRFPAGKRPSCKYSFIFDDVNGEIGEIYLYEHAMHMCRVCVNIYDSENTEELIKENHILDVSDVVLSELLICLQQAIDPAKENAELSAAIEKANKIENGKSPLAQILTECGIYALSLTDYGYSPRFCDGKIAEDVDYVCVSGDDVLLTLESSTVQVNTVSLNDRCLNYSWIVEAIKAAANIAYKKSKS
jgi:hypothetical protein